MKRLLTAVFALLFSPLALAGVTIEHWTTAHGARVYFAASQALPIVDIQVDFAAGSMFDPADKAGLAALTRATLDLGAGPRDENGIAEQLADLGARLGGGADHDRASLSLRSLSSPEIREPALSILRDILRSPRFAPEIVAREQARSATSLKDALTRPDTIASRAFWASLYPQHPYGRQPTPDSINALQRDDLLAFHARHYTAANASITLVGDLSRAQAETIAQQLAEALPAGQPVNLPDAPEAPAGRSVAIAHPASQAHVYLGLPAIERGHPDYFPLLVGNYTLGGGGFVSRLMKQVRDQHGYAYSVYSYFAPLRQSGPFQIGLQTKRSQAADAVKLAREILTDFVAQGPSADELAAAKANLTGSFPLRLDSNSKILGNVAAIGFYGLPLDYLDRYQSKIQAVTVNQIRAAFSRHVPVDRLITLTVAAD
ncbi:MAG: pitrilysin family protein [Dechloromonas sp.]|nr:pitrilysin family protein [Dechloromonas sp.]